ncbi:MAG: membrane dipeptidase [Geminicoccaceae bacterium]|mgnify:CR=1 FL=1|nr:membrane dipeptidase [Geminicoccaceae bacterium]
MDAFRLRHLLSSTLLAAALVATSPAAFAVKPYEEGEGGSTSQPDLDDVLEEHGNDTESSGNGPTGNTGTPRAVTVDGFALADVPRTGPRLATGYAMTHEHPTHGMAFGGNYGFAGHEGNYVNGIPEDGYQNQGACSGCCDHGEFKGNLIPYFQFSDMGRHDPHGGARFDSFSHLRYSSDWIENALDPGPGVGADTSMKILVAFAVESESMCELVYYDNRGKGGAGGAGYPCSEGDSLASLVRQIDALKAWAAAHDWAEIAYSAAEARAIANAGKLAVVLGVEADYTWGAEDRTFDPVARLRDYRDMGVRTFYLAHKINSRLAGADIFRSPSEQDGKSIRALQGIAGCFYYDDNVGEFPLGSYCDNFSRCGANAFRGPLPTDQCATKVSDISEANLALYLLTGSINGFAVYPRPPGFSDPSGGSRMDGAVERNNLSLSIEGSRVVVEAMRHGMIMDLGHVSSKARTDIHDHSQAFYNYPLNALHNNPNEMLIEPAPNEYDFDKSERDYVRETGGMFGLRLGPVDARSYAASGVTANCPKTSTENAKILAYLLDEGQRVGYSLDFATVTEGTHSRTLENCGIALGHDYIDRYAATGAPNDTVTHGLAHIGNMEAWHDELLTVGLKQRYVDKLENQSAEWFLRMWEKSEFTARMPPTVMAIL